MIWMGVIISNHPEPAAACVIIGSFVLLRCDQITGLAGLLSFVLCEVHFGKDVCLAITVAQQKSTAFVGVGLLAVRAYLIKVL